MEQTLRFVYAIMSWLRDNLEDRHIGAEDSGVHANID